MTRTIAVVSQKGGVGKTSLVQNLGAELAQNGRKVLLVDFDPQSNLTIGWGLDPGDGRATIYNALSEPGETAGCIVNLRQNLDLIPANLDLAGAELAFVSDFINRNNKLKKALDTLSGYDILLIDGPPSLGFFTINALMAASEILLPLQVQAYAYKALDQLLEIVDEVREIHSELILSGIVLTMYDVRNALTTTVEEMTRERFGDLVHQTVIPVNVRIAEAPLSGVSIGEYEANSKGAQAYRSLAQEVLSGKA
jgi:chromosome partitioning protein